MANPTHTRAPTAHIAPFGVRMQPELKERLEAAAQASGRSLNAEIVARLEQSLTGTVDAHAVTTLVYRIATLELDHELRRTELTTLAAHLLTAIRRYEAAISHGKNPPSKADVARWSAEAQKFLVDHADLEKAIEGRLEALRTILGKVHGASTEEFVDPGPRPIKPPRRVSRKLEPKG